MSDCVLAPLLFIDLETTGLDPFQDRILEVGFLITDGDLNEIGHRSWVLHQAPDVLGGMSDWCLRQHGRSGLIADCAASKLDLHSLESQSLGWLGTMAISAGTAPMCGCSVHFDRAFLRNHMPGLERWFHYSNLDVSSVEKAFEAFCPVKLLDRARNLHRVDPDNEDAVAQLRWYRQVLQRAQGADIDTVVGVRS